MIITTTFAHSVAFDLLTNRTTMFSIGAFLLVFLQDASFHDTGRDDVKLFTPCFVCIDHVSYGIFTTFRYLQNFPTWFQKKLKKNRRTRREQIVWL